MPAADLIVDGLFGPEHGERWMLCGSAVATGLEVRATFLAGRQVYGN